MGAKLAAPDKLCVSFQGDSAFGMTGLDLETAARCELPILSVVLNNGTMAIEATTLVESHARYRTRDVGGDYATIASALGVPARRIEHPAQLREAFEWAKRTTADGRPAVLDVITSAEQEFSNRGRWRPRTTAALSTS
jgi:acetolactate synthase-1/2/3 large subunit